uniref:Secreted protein n=1 Tax=Parastrongyloides trichosuri TaxID=131310 RepID=A0A0N4Z1D0_PARTI
MLFPIPLNISFTGCICIRLQLSWGKLRPEPATRWFDYATGSVCFHRIGFTSSLTLSPEYFAIFLHSTCSLSDS